MPIPNIEEGECQRCEAAERDAAVRQTIADDRWAAIERLEAVVEHLRAEVARLSLENAGLALVRGQRDVMREGLRRFARLTQDPAARAVAMQAGAWKEADLVPEFRRFDCDELHKPTEPFVPACGLAPALARPSGATGPEGGVS